MVQNVTGRASGVAAEPMHPVAVDHSRFKGIDLRWLVSAAVRLMQRRLQHLERTFRQAVDVRPIAAVEDQLGLLWRVVVLSDACEALEVACACLRYEAIGGALRADLESGCDMSLEEASRPCSALTPS